ncbi:hypothetical protein [Streptomyces wuyuanensis]|uniref:hypothetical protein n=1 Tax=Streptomyces wuyuanensis TaxID=1196353 RepID=UPI00341ED22F
MARLDDAADHEGTSDQGDLAKARTKRAASAPARELLAFTAAPLPPLPRPPRYLPHALIVVAAVLLFLAGGPDLINFYDLNTATALVVAAASAATLVLALYAPAPAWWCSIALCATTATTLHFTQWPWPALLAHAGVLLLLSLRVGARTALLALILTGVVTVVLPLAGPGVPEAPLNTYRNLSLVVFTAATTTGTLVRAVARRPPGPHGRPRRPTPPGHRRRSGH